MHGRSLKARLARFTLGFERRILLLLHTALFGGSQFFPSH
jgi:hypothetical protein